MVKPPARRFRKPSARPCVFKEAFVREQVDPRVKEVWERATGGPAPFGRLRKAFQEEHCAKINPYTGGECPYRVEECAMAFLSGVQNATLPWIEDPAAYFVKLVASTGIDRADHKPLAREHHRDQEGQDDGGGRRAGSSAGRQSDLADDRRRPVVSEVLGRDAADLRGSSNRPESIGSLLRAFDLGPHSRPERDGRGESEGEE